MYKREIILKVNHVEVQRKKKTAGQREESRPKMAKRHK
jgi:hypothetical protein